MATTRTSTDANAGPAAASKPKRKTRRRVVEEAVRGYFEAIEQRDTERMTDFWAADGIDEIVPVGIFRGHEEIKGFFRELFASTPDLETTVERVVADEKRASVEWRMRGHFTGSPFQGIHPNGKRIEMRGLDIFEVEDGKITSNTGYYDGMHFARQVGLMPPQDSGAERAMKNAFNAVTKVRKAINERAGS